MECGFVITVCDNCSYVGNDKQALSPTHVVPFHDHEVLYMSCSA